MLCAFGIYGFATLNTHLLTFVPKTWNYFHKLKSAFQYGTNALIITGIVFLITVLPQDTRDINVITLFENFRDDKTKERRLNMFQIHVSWTYLVTVTAVSSFSVAVPISTNLKIQTRCLQAAVVKRGLSGVNRKKYSHSFVIHLQRKLGRR